MSEKKQLEDLLGFHSTRRETTKREVESDIDTQASNFKRRLAARKKRIKDGKERPVEESPDKILRKRRNPSNINLASCVASAINHRSSQ